MTKVRVAITTSLDGFIAGPNDRPGQGLGEGGERLHDWMFGGPWTPEKDPTGATGADKEFLDTMMARLGAVVGGRTTYDLAEAWGGSNPYAAPFFIVTHRPHEAPPGGAFNFVNGVDEAIQQARKAAGDKDVRIMGGGDVIRQALRGGYVDELAISVAPRVLGGGKRLFDGFTESIELEHIRVLESPFATHMWYRVVR